MTATAFNPEDVTRGELLALANKLLEHAGERNDVNDRARFFGSPRDPVVRKAAAMMLHRLHDIDDLSFDEIGKLFGCSKERAFQLYKELIDRVPQEK